MLRQLPSRSARSAPCEPWRAAPRASPVGRRPAQRAPSPRTPLLQLGEMTQVEVGDEVPDRVRDGLRLRVSVIEQRPADTVDRYLATGRDEDVLRDGTREGVGLDALDVAVCEVGRDIRQ